MSSIDKQPCTICTDNRPITLYVICPKCKFSCCRTCTKRYLLEQQSSTPKCMNCNIQWSYEFLYENTENGFYNLEYRDHRAKISLSIEKSLLPATQPYVLTEIKRRDFSDQIKQVDEIIKLHRNFLEKISVDKREKYFIKIGKYVQASDEALELDDLDEEKRYNDKITEMYIKIDMIELKKKDTKKLLIDLNHKKRVIYRSRKELDLPSHSQPRESTETTRFIGHCPQDDCKGYLDSAYICGLCNEKTCRSCRKPEHKDDCDKDLVETIKLLAKDTKGCPNCGVPIFKISGCSQMWCSSCHTAFNWDTGKVETGRIHNPHFYEWQRKNGGVTRELGDVRCGGIVDFNSLMYRLTNSHVEFKLVTYVTNAYRYSIHIRHVEMPIIRHVENDIYNRNLRVRYLIGDFTEKKWLIALKKRDKLREKRQAELMILTMLVDTMDDLFANMLVVGPTVFSYIEQLRELNSYVNMNLLKIGSIFKNKAFKIPVDWAGIFYRE